MSRAKQGQTFQDWEPMVIRKSKNAPQNQGLKNRKPGQETEVQKKVNAGKNVQHRPPDARKIEEEEEEGGSIPTVGLSLGQRIQQARAAKGWSQKDLAMRISEKAQVVQQYEQGKAIPNSAVLAKMEQALGVKLRGDNPKKNSELKSKDDGP
jgi:putative transcription factor